VRSLDAIHLATAQQLAADLGRLVTYDERMFDAAKRLGFRTAAPT
jgi:predicted nucleic acid-binding protein